MVSRSFGISGASLLSQKIADGFVVGPSRRLRRAPWSGFDLTGRRRPARAPAEGRPVAIAAIQPEGPGRGPATLRELFCELRTHHTGKPLTDVRGSEASQCISDRALRFAQAWPLCVIVIEQCTAASI